MSSTTLDFSGKTVIVTGAGRGLGRDYALNFAQRGANVVVNDLGVTAEGDGASTSVAQTVVDEIVAAGGKAVADTHSVADAEGAQAVVKTASDAFGSVDVLINNAGIISYHLFGDLNEQDWQKMIAVTLNGTFFMSKAVWPHFVKQGAGRIVNVTSNAGFAGSEQLSHYGAAKMGVAGLTKNLAIEGAPLGIRVNAVAPMAVTRMNSAAFFGGEEADASNWKEDMASGKVPIGPTTTVTPTVIWLAHESTAFTGEIFSSSSGKVGRVAVVVGEGYFDPDHTPEDLSQNADKISQLGDFIEPKSSTDEIASIRPLFV